MARKDRKDRTAPPADVDPGATGSIDVQLSGTALPRARTAEPASDDEPTRPAGLPPEISASITTSMDVQFSSTAIPTVRQPEDAGESGSVDVQMSGPMPVARVEQRTAPRRRARTVPGIIAESLSNLPVVKEVMPKSRRGRLLFRSVVVAFMLIGIWIGVIVYLQLRGGEPPDFRPQVEAIFGDLRDGEFGGVYDHASVRFQEITLEENFEDRVRDQNHTLGKFIEVAAVIRTEVFRGASGKSARVDLLLEFETGRCKGSMSFHFEDAQWRMLGYSIELPDDIAVSATSPKARQERVRGPKEIEDLAVKILEQSRNGEFDAIWEAAAPVFRDSIDKDPEKSKQKFHDLEATRREALGPYRRVLSITSATKNPSETGASLTALLEFGDGQTVNASFKFIKLDGVWKLAFYKVIMPMPHTPVVD